MVNLEDFIGRLEHLLQYYGLSASGFADKIGVQRSSISHLLSGRNKPSLDFVMKVVRTFPEVNLYWLLNGKGSFPGNSDTVVSPIPVKGPHASKERPPGDDQKSIDKIIIFYSDGSFDAYGE